MIQKTLERKCDVRNGESQNKITDACTGPLWELCRHFYAVAQQGEGSLVQRELSADRLTEGLSFSSIDIYNICSIYWNLANEFLFTRTKIGLQNFFDIIFVSCVSFVYLIANPRIVISDCLNKRSQYLFYSTMFCSYG